jgi:hypothetical protein
MSSSTRLAHKASFSSYSEKILPSKPEVGMLITRNLDQLLTGVRVESGKGARRKWVIC